MLMITLHAADISPERRLFSRRYHFDITPISFIADAMLLDYCYAGAMPDI